MSLEVLPAGVSPDTMNELRAISDAWLTGHSTAEKGFSLGAFSTDYVERNSIAVVKVGARKVAFASLLTTDLAEEASVDLMRHVSDAPNGTMDFLFAKLLLHFQAQGFKRFGLGMAPLSGMAAHPLAPLISPRSIAFVGASERKGSPGNNAILEAVRGGFHGKLYPINPRYNEIEGIPCFPSLRDLPAPPDLAILLLANDKLEAALVEAVAAGVKGAVILDSCFLPGDTDPPLTQTTSASSRWPGTSSRLGIGNRSRQVTSKPATRPASCAQ
jgi:hypothetical protein